ncbi:MAG: ATP-dependent DNA helicase RecG, partial [Marinilabiliales bacterium]
MLEQELGITNYGDLLWYFPYRHIDRTRIYKVSEIQADFPYVQLKGYIRDMKLVPMGRRKRLVAYLYDQTGSVELVWFQGIKWVKDSIKAN